MSENRRNLMQLRQFPDASRYLTWQACAGPRPDIAGRLIAVWEAPFFVTDWSECIVAIAKTQDRQRFAALFAHFGPRLKSYFLRLDVAPGMAEDLAQDTMLMVWRKADRFNPERAAASTWIFTSEVATLQRSGSRGPSAWITRAAIIPWRGLPPAIAKISPSRYSSLSSLNSSAER